MVAVIVEKGDVQICKKCGWEIGSDKAERCNRCHSTICPYCNKCNCGWIDVLSGSVIFGPTVRIY